MLKRIFEAFKGIFLDLFRPAGPLFRPAGPKNPKTTKKHKDFLCFWPLGPRGPFKGPRDPLKARPGSFRTAGRAPAIFRSNIQPDCLQVDPGVLLKDPGILLKDPGVLLKA